MSPRHDTTDNLFRNLSRRTIMKLGLVIYSNDPESVWNAFRFGNHAIQQPQDEV